MPDSAPVASRSSSAPSSASSERAAPSALALAAKQLLAAGVGARSSAHLERVQEIFGAAAEAALARGVDYLEAAEDPRALSSAATAIKTALAIFRSTHRLDAAAPAAAFDFDFANGAFAPPTGAGATLSGGTSGAADAGAGERSAVATAAALGNDGAEEGSEDDEEG